MAKTNKTPAFAYLRVSGKGQVKGDGFPRQIEAIRSYTQAHGLRIVKVFEERGVSGKSELENRPALMALHEALAANGTKLVLIEKLDRLARDLIVQEHIIADLRASGFEIISVAEPDLCVDDPSRKLMRQIMGAIAEYDKTMIVAKLRGARQRIKAKTGRCEGRKLFGEKPGQADVRDRIRAMRKAGATLQSICDTLNAEGVKTPGSAYQTKRPSGRAWMPMTVARIAERKSKA